MAVLMAVATAAQVIGTIADTNAKAGQYRAQGQIEDYNARVLDGRAAQARSEGARNEEQFRRSYRDFAGTQAASISESGLSGDGSALDVVRDSETRANLDALKIRYEATNQGSMLASEAAGARMRSSLAKQMAKRAQIAGAFDTIGAGARGAFATRAEYRANGNKWL